MVNFLFIARLIVVLTMARCALAATANDWTSATPEEVGIDSVVLAQMFDAVADQKIPVHSVQIARYGRLVLDAYFYPYQAGTRHDVASVTKSITSTLVGLAIERGHINGVTQRVVESFPDRQIAGLDERKQRLKLEHLLTMQAGWDCGFEPNERRLMEMRRSKDWIQFMLDLPMIAEPGTRWAYCSGNCHLLSALLTKVTGSNALAFARRELFTPLGVEDVAWPADAAGHNHGWGDLQLHPRDMAKIGQLFLQRGRWGERQIIPERWIAAATAPHVNRTSNKDHYGYLWWVKGDEFPTMFEAVGRGGQRINVWPQKQLVIVFTGGGFEPGDLGKFIVKALKSDKPLSPNTEAARQLDERIRNATKPPVPSIVSRLPAIAAKISGRLFTLSSNTLDLRTLSFKFEDPGQAEAVFGLDKQRLTFPIGLDGVERFSTNAITALPQTAKGHWSRADTFVLEVDLVGGINCYTVENVFSENGRSVKVHFSEGTGLNEETFHGRAVK